MANQLHNCEDTVHTTWTTIESFNSCSVLFDVSESQYAAVSSPPDFFGDLNLDQVIDSVVAGREQYDLKSLFYQPLASEGEVNYRLAVFRDLEDDDLLECIRSFCNSMVAMRQSLSNSERRYYKHEREWWFLSAAQRYIDSLDFLAARLTRIALRSHALEQFCQFLCLYLQTSEFKRLAADTRDLCDQISGIRYALHISGGQVIVARQAAQDDYGAQIRRTFDKFSQQASKEYKFELTSVPEMNHIEAAITDMVARLYPGIFDSFQRYLANHRGYCHPAVNRFDREIQFYLAYVDYIQRLKAVGLPFCYPVVSSTCKEVSANEGFDIGLAMKLSQSGKPVVRNGFFLAGDERIFLISGPNQGGKTTFARMFGQMHYLASIGCPVPGKWANLFLYDRIFAHFERQEQLCELHGKLEHELTRMHAILCAATDRSILIMNESFLSTTVSDALLLNAIVLDRVRSLGALCVAVTFLDELATGRACIVSMASCVDPTDPSVRTFRIIRQAPAGQAFAMSIAHKYGLTYEMVKMRIAKHLELDGAR